MKPTMRKAKRLSRSPLKPRKLAKQVNNEEAIEQDDQSVFSPEQIEDQEKTEDDNVNPKVIQSPKQEVQTNSTVLSKQIKIVSQLNAKQVDGLISDRNTIKAHGS